MIDSTVQVLRSANHDPHDRDTPQNLRLPSGHSPAVPEGPKPLPPARPAPHWTIRRRLGAALRRTVGISLVLAAGWWLVLPLLFPVTSDAVVNARTVQVRAPIDGTASELALDVGDPVAAGQSMASLVNRHLDKSGLTLLSAKRAELAARRERLEKELAEVVKSEAVCRTGAKKYNDAMVANLEASHRELESKAKSGRVEYDAAVRRLERVRRISSSSSGLELDAAVESESVNRIRLETDKAALARSAAELESGKKGLFLQKDAPHFQQRAEELAQRVPTLESTIREASDLLTEVEAEIEREKLRTERLSLATAEAPVAGTVWARQGNRGQGVRQNEVLYEIADGRTVFVEAVVHQRYLGSVAPGTPATVNVTGGPSLPGRVRAVRTGRPSENEPSFAFGAHNADPRMLRVMIDLEPGFGEPCALIGRHVRVLVADCEEGPCHRAVVWLFSHARLR